MKLIKESFKGIVIFLYVIYILGWGVAGITGGFLGGSGSFLGLVIGLIVGFLTGSFIFGFAATVISIADSLEEIKEGMNNQRMQRMLGNINAAPTAREQAQQVESSPQVVSLWTCPYCGSTNKGKFCGKCGRERPVDSM